MKKLTFLAVGLAFASLIFYACEDGLREQEVSSPQLIEEESSGLYRGGCVIREICFPEIRPGTRLLLNSSLCLPGTPYQCSYFTGKQICIPIIVDCFWKWDIPWRDPWDWREFIEVPDIYDFRKELEGIIDPREDFGMFRINENILGMQYYNEVPGLIDKEVFHVHSSIELDAKTAESMGLKGNIIPAGTYPVAYNDENGTFNAIVSVDSYPISREKRIGVGKFEGTSLTEFLADPQFEQVEVGTITETANGVGLVGYTPHPDDPNPRPWPWPGPWPWPWISVFSPNDLSLGIQVYEPDPEPWELQENIMLNERIAEIVGIEAFELTNENMEFEFNKELGITTIFFHRSK